MVWIAVSPFRNLRVVLITFEVGVQLIPDEIYADLQMYEKRVPSRIGFPQMRDRRDARLVTREFYSFGPVQDSMLKRPEYLSAVHFSHKLLAAGQVLAAGGLAITHKELVSMCLMQCCDAFHDTVHQDGGGYHSTVAM